MTTNQFSYYLPPVRNTLPLNTMDLASVYVLVKTNFFKTKTEQVRRGEASKSEVLAFITPSGIFKRRRLADLISYSPIICIDLDHCDTTLKTTLTQDTFLRPALIFVSPSGTGLKVFIQIENARQEDHVAHFNAIAYYLRETYNLEVDQACKDLPRACFLCYDPEAMFSFSSIDSKTLLAVLPPDQPEAANRNSSSVIRNSSSVIPDSSFVIGNSPSDRLNHLPAIHERAVNALRVNGWSRTGDRWTRPGKPAKNGTSAIFNLYHPEGCHFFTNFSTNGAPFEVKGYTDTGVICELEFGGDFEECIHTLAREYLP